MQRVRNVLVVCPASLRLNWKNEVQKWSTHKCQVHVVVGGKQEAWPTLGKGCTQYVVINYDVLAKHRARIDKIKWDVLIADEAHTCRNPDSGRTKAMLGHVTHSGRQTAKPIAAAHRIFLTGTPILNKPVDLWPLLQSLDPKGLGRSWWGYVKRYCKARKGRWGWDFSGASNLEELQEKLRSSLMVRRLKQDVLKELPAKRRQVIELPANGATGVVEQELHVYRSHKEFIASLQSQLAAMPESDEQYSKLKKKLSAAKKLAFEELAKARYDTAMAKAPKVVDFLQTALEESGQPVVVFAHHKDVITTIAEAFKDNCCVVTGATSLKKRQQAVEDFQNGKKQVFIGNIQAAGVGITLTRSSHVVFAELDWVPANLCQAEDRCLLAGQLVPCLQPVYDESGTCTGESMSIKNVENIQVGDKVLTHTGKEQRVTNTSSHLHMDGRITSISYTGWSEPIECTFDHKWLIRRKEADDPLDFNWVQAHQILPGDEMVTARPTSSEQLDVVEIKKGWRRWETSAPTTCIHNNCNEPIEARSMCRVHYRQLLRIPADKRPPAPKLPNGRYVRLPDKVQINNDWLFVFGLFAAEGFSQTNGGKGRFVSISSHKNKIHLLKRCEKVFAKLGIKCSIYKSKTSKSVELRAYSYELAMWFREWFGHTAYRKSLPQVLVDLPPEQAVVVLKAYLDGDGYRRNGINEWVSASETLAYQFALLASKCGYTPTLRKVWSKASNIYHFIGSYANSSHSHCPYIFRKVRKVETTNEKRPKVYDLTVEKDHSFVVGLATAHNCHRIGQQDSVLVQHIVLEDSLDSLMSAKILKKQAVIDKALN